MITLSLKIHVGWGQKDCSGIQYLLGKEKEWDLDLEPITHINIRWASSLSAHTTHIKTLKRRK